MKMPRTFAAPDATDDFQALTADRKAFNELVYTPLDEALEELKRRWHDEELKKRVTELLHHDVPAPFQEGSRAAIVRHVITPNYEIRRFLQLSEIFKGIRPLLIEYAEDKFTSNNEWKHSLGKLGFFLGKNRNGHDRIENLTIIPFDSSNGKPLSEIKTVWGESLVSFHKSLLDQYLPGLEVYDISAWLHAHSQNALGYYQHFIALFVRHGILLENFMLNGKELQFTKDVFLPAFMSVARHTGVKPLIVALEPTEMESNRFWLCHPADTKGQVLEKLHSSRSL